MNRFFGKIALATLLILASSTAYADSQIGNQGLNELLIGKGVITREEVEAQAKKNPLTVNGYIQVQGMITDENHEFGYDSSSLHFENGFQIRRAKIIVSGSPYENINYRLEVNVAKVPKLDDAYIEYNRLPYLVVRIGQFKVPFSLEMITLDHEILSIERSEVVNQIAPDRDMGMMFSGDLVNEILSYNIGVFNGRRADDLHAYKVGSYADSAQNKYNDNDYFLMAGRLVVKPADWVSVGVNALSSEDGHEDPSAIYVRWPVYRNAYGVDLKLKPSRLRCTIQGEYLRQWASGIITQNVGTTSDGFYVQLGHFFIPDYVEGLIKYEEYDADKDVVDRDNIVWTTVGLNFYLHGHDAKLMTNYTLKDEKQSSYPNNSFLAQLQLRF
ncbi:MAG: hypothetical protein HW382_710 [Deltaproteobacteria bacterium]|nr:hypothetical protein [Deltaproteobacteria bacterium]MBM2837771.1 hypothetical protein [Deltaproteobacteria bacterium]